MNETTQTPPEKCPVCGECEFNDVRSLILPSRRKFACGASAVLDADARWFDPCPHAMTAAIRCGATLEPSPLELARTALVDAAVDECAAYDTAMELRLKPGAERERAQELLERARAYLFMTASNYRSALLESRP